MTLYGQFVGGWESDIVSYEEDSTKHHGRGRDSLRLGARGPRNPGRLDDSPRRAERCPGMPAMPVAGNWYGTTLRVYDPGLDAWHILWSDPATQVYTRQIGRARGADIVQEGKLPTGAMLRWRFTEITANTFHWIGEHSADNGTTWRLQVEVFARRVSSA